MPEDDRPDWIARIAERKIAEAIEQGVFDNLPGMGKPIPLDDDPLTPPHMRAANRILRNAGVVPDWIGIEKEIEDARLQADRFRDEWLERGPQVAEGELAAARVKYERLMRACNDLILRHNLSFSFVHRSPIPIRVKQRLAEWDEAMSATPRPIPCPSRSSPRDLP